MAGQPAYRAPMEHSSAPIEAGALGHRYFVIAPIGGGGMGLVFSAYDPKLDRRVAVKVLRQRPGCTHDDEWRARFAREAQAMARLSHPNVVNVFDVGELDDGQVFLAMELVEGGSLGSWLQAEPRPVRAVLDLFLQAGEGLAAAHDAGIIHRDFKPDNVLVGTDGRARVTDFGIARAGAGDSGVLPVLRGSDASRASASDRALENPITRAGALMGTPGYIAPEQIHGEPADMRSDVFSFCVSLWEALYGSRPFDGKTLLQLAESAKRGPERPSGRARVPGWVQRVLVKGLSYTPDARYPTMRALLSALRADPGARWRRALLFVSFATCIACVVGVAQARGRANVRTCEAAGMAIEQVWGDAQRARVRAALVGTGRSYAEPAWAQVQRALDAYAASWASAREEACAATRVRGEQSEAMLDLRVACLDDRRAELRALEEVLASSDPKLVESAPKAAQGLSAIQECANVDQLSASARLPASAEARDEIRALQWELARAKALSDAGRRREALVTLRSIDQRVGRAPWPPLVVSWHQAMGAAEKDEDGAAAVGHFVEAIALAERDHLDLVKARNAIQLGSFEGNWMGLSAEAHRWMRVADGTIARVGGDPALEVHEAIEEAWLYVYEHKPQLAEPLFRGALARAASAGASTDDVAGAHSGLAEALSAAGRTAEAVDEDRIALRLIEETDGPDHPSVSGYENNLAMILLANGEAPEALRVAGRACALLEEQARRGYVPAATSAYGLAIHTRGEILLRLGRADDAAADLGRARDVYFAVQNEANPDVAYADNDLAQALRALGRSREASRALDEAERVERALPEVPVAIVAETLAIRAHFAIERRDAAAAVVLGERALGAAKVDETSPADLADARLVLAVALHRQRADARRVKSLAEQARDGFARVHDEAHLGEAQAFLRSLDP